MTHPIAVQLRSHAWENREDLALANLAADELDRLHQQPRQPARIAQRSLGFVLRPRGEGAQDAFDSSLFDRLDDADDDDLNDWMERR